MGNLQIILLHTCFVACREESYSFNYNILHMLARGKIIHERKSFGEKAGI